MHVRTRVIREGRALYLLEDVTLPEGQPLIVTIEVPRVDEDGDLLDEDGIPIQETLADVLGFDPEDEERLLAEDERQRQALQELVGMFKIADYPPDGKPSAAVYHDEYIYKYKERLLAEGKHQRQALLAMAGTASSGLTDVSERHDYYIYVEPHERQCTSKK